MLALPDAENDSGPLTRENAAPSIEWYLLDVLEAA
jgi:hypothetical protein